MTNLGPGNYYFVAVAVNASNQVSDFSNQAHAPIPAPPRPVIVEPPTLRMTGVVYRATSAAGPWAELLRLPAVDVPTGMEGDTAFFRMGVEWDFIQPADGE